MPVAFPRLLRRDGGAKSGTLPVIMARAHATKVEALLTQIESLAPAERATLLARVLTRSGAKPDRAVLRRIRRRLRTRDAAALDRAADEAMREVQRSRG